LDDPHIVEAQPPTSPSASNIDVGGHGFQEVICHSEGSSWDQESTYDNALGLVFRACYLRGYDPTVFAHLSEALWDTKASCVLMIPKWNSEDADDISTPQYLKLREEADRRAAGLYTCLNDVPRQGYTQ
jgi:hypothetical protein